MAFARVTSANAVPRLSLCTRGLATVKSGQVLGWPG